MAKRIEITGLDEINRNLKQYAKRLKENERPALTEMVAVIQKTSMKYTPVDVGVLMGSHRARVTKLGKKWFGTIRLSAVYALFVHEAKKGTSFKSPWPKGRKFLDRAFTDKLKELQRILFKWMKKAGKQVGKQTAIAKISKDIMTGSRGGRFYMTATGHKAYVKRN